ncbi:hypothetical protein GCM10023405_14840 [Streptomonospora salina]
MRGSHHVRPSHIKDLVAAFEPAEIIEVEIMGLKHRAHCAVGDEDTLGEGITEGESRTHNRQL